MKSLRLLAALAALIVSASAAEIKMESAFNGKDLAGWQNAKDNEFWKAVDGVLVGENNAAKKGNMLYTEKSYQDAVIECEVRFSGDIDSGIMMRKDEKGKKDIQMQIGVSRSLKKDMTCAFYVGKYPESGWAPKVATLWKNNDWNKIRFQAKGDTYTVWLNGEQVSNYVDAGYPKAAPIGLQIHPGVVMKVEYRNISVGEIK
ncbi:MAG: DUF1080 domain-containing protein [Opitutales bacterium]|jgi:hypothetical protein|nr:DUF1080 domain-containing protein [Opitutales bacterium]